MNNDDHLSKLTSNKGDYVSNYLFTFWLWLKSTELYGCGLNLHNFTLYVYFSLIPFVFHFMLYAYMFDHKIGKTDYAHGPAQVVFRIALYNRFQIFIDNSRRFYGIQKTGSTPVFVPHNENPMQSSHASGRLMCRCREKVSKKVVKRITHCYNLVNSSRNTRFCISPSSSQLS